MLIRPISPVPGVVTDYVIGFSADAEFKKSDVMYVTFPGELNVNKYKGKSRRCTSLFYPDDKISCKEVSTNRLRITGLFTTNDKTYAVKIQTVRNMKSEGYTSNFKIEVDSKDGSYKAEKATQLRISMLEELD